MSELTEKSAEFFKVLADQTRLEILELLKKGERTSNEIEDALEKSQYAIFQHLKILLETGLIHLENKRNKTYFRIKYDYVFKILRYAKSLVITLHKEKLSPDKQ